MRKKNCQPRILYPVIVFTRHKLQTKRRQQVTSLHNEKYQRYNKRIFKHTFDNLCEMD